ncbi:MAG: efflux RND transporter periplasmic adaptor subunit [Candidatus Aminicenantes bacterium]|nr:efflux RND transporter periplasmic adaptor subunit [Candidatus Aminicenantes bacterium]
MKMKQVSKYIKILGSPENLALREGLFQKGFWSPKALFLILIITLLSALLLTTAACGKKKQAGQSSGQASAAQSEAPKQQRYHCPMHPTYTSDKQGSCPICGMNLVPIPESAKPTAKKIIRYRSTMNPQEISDKPGKDSMGMDMIPFEMAGETGTGPAGLAAVTINPADSTRLGLNYGVVEMKRFIKEIRTSARIAADETRQVRVTSRIEGWVEKLYVNVTGQLVKKGTPLLSIYSPELVAAQQELLTAVTMVREFKGSDFENLARQGQNVLDAARQRLKLWEITDKQIEQIEKNGQVQKSLTLFAPASGFVSEKTVLPGQKIMAGESLMVITDLSHVWAMADIYEADLPYVKIGTSLDITLPNQPGNAFSGEIIFLEPGLDGMTRTLKARIDIVNDDFKLKPEMYADARLKIDLGEKLTVPESAVMRSGDRDYVFAVGKEGQLQPVEIKIGARSGDFFEMISGLYEGDKVVTSANFLIDSESSLKAALEAVTTQPTQPEGGHAHD